MSTLPALSRADQVVRATWRSAALAGRCLHLECRAVTGWSRAFEGKLNDPPCERGREPERVNIRALQPARLSIAGLLNGRERLLDRNRAQADAPLDTGCT